MRVVLVNQYYAPSEAPTARLLCDLAEGLVAAGNRVTVICSGRDYVDPARRYPGRESLRGVEVRRTWSTGFGRGGRTGRVLDYLSFLLGAVARLVTGRRADVVVALTTPPMLSPVALAACRLRGTRCVHWVMDVYPDIAFELGVLRAGSPGGRLLSRLARRAWSGADAVVALGETMARRLTDSGASRVEVVHNWADGEAVVPRPVEGHELREAWGWAGKFVVLHSGNMGLAHEFDTVVGAAGLLRDDPRILFAFVGDGPRRAEIAGAAEAQGLPNVCFRPYVPLEQLGAGLTTADLHLVTLRDRMAGLLVPSKLYGILAAGRPTVYVGPAEGEVPEILRQGACGVAVATGDARGLAAAIQRYADDEPFRREHGRSARRLFERRFTRTHGVTALRRVIEGGKGGAEA